MQNTNTDTEKTSYAQIRSHIGIFLSDVLPFSGILLFVLNRDPQLQKEAHKGTHARQGLVLVEGAGPLVAASFLAPN